MEDRNRTNHLTQQTPRVTTNRRCNTPYITLSARCAEEERTSVGHMRCVDVIQRMRSAH
jgi:hypothetical protein